MSSSSIISSSSSCISRKPPVSATSSASTSKKPPVTAATRTTTKTSSTIRRAPSSSTSAPKTTRPSVRTASSSRLTRPNTTNQKSSSPRSLPPPAPYDLRSPQTVHVNENNIPIMFTAPHGLELYRFKNGGKTRIVHRREHLTTELALLLSKRVGEILFWMWVDLDESKKNNKLELAKVPKKNCNFCVWNCVTSKPFDPKNTDPNYTFKRQFETSPWNASLRKFNTVTTKQRQGETGVMAASSGNTSVSASKAKAQNDDTIATSKTSICIKILPLHIDLHGKIDRKDNFNLDVGLDSFLEFHQKSQPQLCQALFKNCQKEFTEAMQHCPVKLAGKVLKDSKKSRNSSSSSDSDSDSDDSNSSSDECENDNKMKTNVYYHPASVDMEPWLSGLWGTAVDDPTMPVTMTTQATLQNIPSFQLEIPRTMRKAMMAWWDNGVTSDRMITITPGSEQDKSKKFFEAFATSIAKIFLGIQNVPVEVVLEKMFSGSGSTNVSDEEEDGKKLIEFMLNDCKKKLKTEKPQI